MTTHYNSLGRLESSETAVFICDVQERFRPVISLYPAVMDTSQRMIKAATVLSMPIIVTEQYPKALGNTVVELTEHLPSKTPIIPKTNFSMMVPEVIALLEAKPSVKKVLMLGIETHVCVLQTTLDLIEKGYEVHVVCDGVSSQRLEDRGVALRRMAQSGAFLTTSEMVLFQMMKDTAHPAFKTISGLAKEARPEQLPVH
jgi:nicotinamidase-related amidase